MATHEQFEQLRTQHAAGRLSDREFAEASAALLHSHDAPMAPAYAPRQFWKDGDGNLVPLKVVDDSPAARELEALDNNWGCMLDADGMIRFRDRHPHYNTTADARIHYVSRRREIFAQLGLQYADNVKVVKRVAGTSGERLLTFRGRVWELSRRPR
jgi:hypothetical protein